MTSDRWKPAGRAARVNGHARPAAGCAVIWLIWVGRRASAMADLAALKAAIESDDWRRPRR